MKWLKNNKRLAFVIVVFIVVFFVLKGENLNLKHDLMMERSIPDVELVNSLSLDKKGVVSGSAAGFILFDETENQPKEFQQYAKITALNNFANAGRQQFYLEDIFKFQYLSTRYLEPVLLTAIDVSLSTITLSDTANNLFFIDRNTGEIKTLDATGNSTRLITSDSEYREFVRKLLQ